MAEAQISSLVKRLEAATARLEEIARGKAGSGITDASSASTSNSSAGGTEPLIVKEYDNIISGSFKAYLDASNNIGGSVKEQVNIFSYFLFYIICVFLFPFLLFQKHYRYEKMTFLPLPFVHFSLIFLVTFLAL